MASLTLAVAHAGVLHVLEVTAPWLDDFHQQILQAGLARVEAMEAASAADDRAHTERVDAVTAWFDAVVDRLVADDKRLALTQEAARKQHVRALAEAELGQEYEKHLPQSRSVASMVNQAVQIAFSRRCSVLERRCAALAARLPDLATVLADVDGYRGASKDDRQRLAREHLAAADRLVKPGSLASELVRAADDAIAARGPGHRGSDPVAEPGLF